MNTVTRTLRALSVARAAAVACAMLTSAVANATDAVQWRVEDGGNGHWYQVTVSELIGNSWVTARAMAQGLGGDLATFGTLTEWNHVTSNVIAGDTAGPNPQTMYLGGRKIDNDWGWADGSPWPSNPPWFQPGICPGVAAPNGDGTVLQSFCFGLFWDDRPEVGGGALNKALIEWSADCNNDGLVDYGQILSGQLADADANGVPDICETLRVPQEYATIQAAVDAAVNGNTVLVGPGTYAPFDIAGKSIAIRSTQGAAATIIDGSGQGRSTVVFGIGTTLRTTLAGFTVRCGMGTGAYWYAKGGGCYIEHGNATFEDCDFTGGVYGCGYGGGIFGSGGSFIVRRCSFLGTSAIHDAGGLQLTAGFMELAEQIPNEPAGVRVLVEDCTVTNCYGYNAGGMAIGLVDATEQQHEEVVLRRTMFAGNVGEYGPSSLFPSDLRLAGAAGGFSSHLFRITNCVFGSESLVFAMCGYWGEGFPLNTLVSDCVFPTGSLRRNCGELSIASSFFCNGTIPVTGAWVDLGGNVTSCPSNGDCDADGVIDFHQIVLGRGEDSNGNWVLDACDAIRVPQDYPTIQAAIDSLAAGVPQTIAVAAGTYHESFALNGKDVIVRGAANNTTILDGTGLTTSIARFTGGEPATAGVESLVFRNGIVGSRFTPKSTFTIGGALYGVNSAAAIRNCRFEQNIADFGGGVYLLRCAMNVVDSDFAGNTARDEGGGMLVYETTGVVSGCDFTQNLSGIAGPGSGSGFKAVGAHAAGETVLLTGCTFVGGISGVNGSAVEYYENTANVPGILRMSGCAITGNSSGLGAGGLRVIGGMYSCVLTGGTSICFNTTSNVDGPYLIEGSATVCDCLADFTHDGVLNGADLGVLLSNWGLTLPSGAGDVNHDGIVNGPDLALLLGSWGPCQ